jgi:hypothetical protein
VSGQRLARQKTDVSRRIEGNKSAVGQAKAMAAEDIRHERLS